MRWTIILRKDREKRSVFQIKQKRRSEGQKSKEQVDIGEPTSANRVEGSRMVAVARKEARKYLGSPTNRPIKLRLYLWQ